MQINKEEKTLVGLIDTGASISALDKKFIEEQGLKPIEEKEVFTANGIIKVPIYKNLFKYEGNSLEMEFITMDIAAAFTFHALLGKNFIDNFNILLFGKEKLFCIQPIHFD